MGALLAQPFGQRPENGRCHRIGVTQALIKLCRRGARQWHVLCKRPVRFVRRAAGTETEQLIDKVISQFATIDRFDNAGRQAPQILDHHDAQHDRQRP
jgi:hypothetical protein